MEKYLEILKQCPLFAGIDEQDLLRMLICLDARVASFDKKYTILAEGKPAKFIGIILSGSAQIIQVDYYGNRSLLSNVAVGKIYPLLLQPNLCLAAGTAFRIFDKLCAHES